MFRISAQEYSVLRSQFVTSTGRIGRRTPPYVFTEHGVAMLSSVLNSDRAVEVNITIIRTFIKMPLMISADKDLAQKLNQLESKYDAQFKVVFNSIRELIETKPKLIIEQNRKRRIGF
jgi:ORF6N domain